ncbi:MAG: SLBB domain-containing protein [Thiotrichales bacterium]|nr:SLBB domain-containing protein [Thiotrichales bacterium]
MPESERQAILEKLAGREGAVLNRTVPTVVDSVQKIYLPEQGYVLSEEDYQLYRQPRQEKAETEAVNPIKSELPVFQQGVSTPFPAMQGMQGGVMQRAEISTETGAQKTPEDKTTEDAVSSQTRLNEILRGKFMEGALNEVVLPYGAQLFAGLPTTFAPVNEVPVPTDYVLGVGDQIIVSLFGTKTQTLQLVIDRNGQVVLPEVGPVNLAGMRFSEAKALLLQKVQALGVGVNAYVNMGELRSFRVFVLGESRAPGSYLVSGMATLSHALYVSGGLSKSGSYRHVQLKRNGKLVKTLDLYDFLLKGDTSNDVRLQPGDTIFIPKVGSQVVVAGEVTRPASYELNQQTTLKQLLGLSGLKPNALQQKIRLSRIQENGSRKWFDFDLNRTEDANRVVLSGDQILVEPVKTMLDKAIKLKGAVAREAEYEWRSGLTVADLLPSEAWFKKDADIENMVLVRQAGISEDYRFIRLNWKEQTTGNAMPLEPRDQLWVLSKTDGNSREQALAQFAQWVQEQSQQDQMPGSVQALGELRFAGSYPLTEQMRVTDLIALAGGLNASAMTKQAEIFRYKLVNGEQKEVQRLVINLADALVGQTAQNITLQPGDALMVKQVSDWSDSTRQIVIKGEVRFPGTYVIESGDTLESVLKRAGGFTQWAEPRNAVFTRKALKEKEQRELSMLADELEKNLLMALKSDAPILEKDTGASIAQMGQSLITKIKNTPALGRLVIGLTPENEERYQSSMNLEIRDGDELFVPKRSSEVVVMGEVARTASLLYQPSLSVEAYLENAGGITKRADDGAIYIVHGDGSIETYSGGLFSSFDNLKVQPGDTIVVPMDIERMNALFTWTSITKVLSNFAITAATLNTIGVW